LRQGAAGVSKYRTASFSEQLLHVLHASSDRDFDTVFETVAQLKAGALVIGADSFLISRSEQLAALGVHHAVPAVFENREFVVAGGLMGYGGSFTESYRLAGNYTGRVLEGDKPADLSVQQGTKVEMYINLKIAKALGIPFLRACSPSPTR
jgi:ABC-type uncharacterized transport system substrate-binding protein